jgi:NAD(P)-dependent dehydrogenase (short-subunit alcohol dehydrogenase family)
VTWTAAELPDLGGRIAVVTGANAGLGFHTARQLALKGARVVLACRNLDAADQAAARIARDGGEVAVAKLDLAAMASVEEFARTWTGRIDLLVNNAGVMAPPRPARTTDGFELQFGINHLGHYVLTGLLLPALLVSASPRVVTVSSIAHHGGTEDVLDANAVGYHPQHSYQQSKLANLLFALELHRQATARGLPLVSVAAHPGVSATGLFTSPEGMGANRLVRWSAPLALRAFPQSPAHGARALLYAAVVAEPGSYTGPSWLGETRGPIGEARRSPAARDEQLARRLWRVSEDLTGLRYPWP